MYSNTYLEVGRRHGPGSPVQFTTQVQCVHKEGGDGVKTMPANEVYLKTKKKKAMKVMVSHPLTQLLAFFER